MPKQFLVVHREIIVNKKANFGVGEGVASVQLN
ncbi:hypothetical protein DEAC_c24690 [Desulfosporosinus acididurans]|uniref:Uncharacterized protein n=1 Tax=Desulfosporosinus acididurans TaxID=476652 RepID=A0A0J1FQQ6_9FIRM|nr:hypothetical protein DEAC_c24690 [Desulfosporosinus acididurans]